jgi:hypothetical protein
MNALLLCNRGGILRDAPVLDWIRYPETMKGRRIPGLAKYRGRNPNGYFQDLDGPDRRSAYYWLHRFCERARRVRGGVPGWLFAIYVGQAKRLALNPPSYEWSRWMNAKKGGYAVQMMYRHEGRNPTEVATKEHQAKAEARRRRKLGLPEPTRHRFLPLD